MSLDIAKVFLLPPEAPNTHILRIEGHDNTVYTIFNALISILKHGIATLHADKGVVNISKLDDDDMQHINMYFNSFGINIRWACNPFEQRRAVEGLKLSDIVYVIRLSSKSIYICFDYYNTCKAVVLKHTDI